MTFYDAFAAGELLGISGSAFRKRAERYGIHPQIWPGNRRKFTIEMIREVEKAGKPVRVGRLGTADHRGMRKA